MAALKSLLDDSNTGVALALVSANWFSDGSADVPRC